MVVAKRLMFMLLCQQMQTFTVVMSTCVVQTLYIHCV